MRALVALLPMAALLAGCVASPPPAIEAPQWEPGFTWSWTARGVGGVDNATVELLAPQHRHGLDGFVASKRQDSFTRPAPPVLWFTTPGSLGLLRLDPSGSLDDICTDLGSYQSSLDWGHQKFEDTVLGLPLLPFPLVPGRMDEFRLGSFLDTTRVQAYRVLEPQTLQTPAGSFSAVPVEVYGWWQSDNETTEQLYAMMGRDRDSVLKAPPAALVHYAPEVRHVVRMESPFGVWSQAAPGQMTEVWAGTTQSSTVMELTSFSLEARPALDGEAAAGRANTDTGYDVFCRGYEERDRSRAEQALPPPSTGFEPRLVQLSKGGQSVSWQVPHPSQNSTYTWLLKRTDGTTLSTGEGPSFQHHFQAEGVYQVHLRAERYGKVVEQDGYVTVDARHAGTVECDPVHADGLLTTLDPEQRLPTSCKPIPLVLASGSAIVTAKLRHGVEGRVPCSHLDLLDSEGQRVASVFTAGSEVTLDTILEGAGNWTLEWHPGAQGPVAPTYEVEVAYQAPNLGLSWSGGGSPGC